jgi:hypothetical protein
VASVVFALLVAFAPIVSHSISATVIPLFPALGVAAVAAALPLLLVIPLASRRSQHAFQG